MSDNAELVAEIAQAYHYLKKQLRKAGQLDKIQEQILDAQWWEDVCPYFGWANSVEFWKARA